MIDRIEARFPPPAWAVFTEVADSTGGPGNRRADALAMSLWPSRGLELHGFEIKMDRRDWIRELKNPAKAETIARYCDRWWVVARDKDLVRDGELPPTWGLLVGHGDGLRCVVEAPKLEAVPMGRHFIASLIRCAHARYDLFAGEAIQRARVDAREDLMKELNERDESELARLKANIDAFEKASGLKISEWNAGRIGNAVRQVMDGESARERERLTGIRNAAAGILERVDEELGKLP